MAINSIHTDGQAPSFSTHFNPLIQRAQYQAANLTKSDLTTDRNRVISHIVREQTITPLVLGKHKVSIPDSTPHRAIVTWPVIGTAALLSYRLPTNHYVSNMSGKNTIEREFEYKSSIAESTLIQSQMSEQIKSLTNIYNEHLKQVNAQIETYNQDLTERVTTWVTERLEELAKIKAAEDFLNNI